MAIWVTNLVANIGTMQVAPPDDQMLNQVVPLVGPICKWQVAPSSGQIRNQFKWCRVIVKFKTDPGDASHTGNLSL